MQQGHQGHQFLPLNWTLKSHHPPPDTHTEHVVSGRHLELPTRTEPMDCHSPMAATSTLSSVLTQRLRAGLWNCFCHSSHHSSSYSIVPLQLKSTPCYSTQFVQWFLKNNSNEKRLHLGDRLLHREPHRQHRPMADKAFKKKSQLPPKSSLDLTLDFLKPSRQKVPLKTTSLPNLITSSTCSHRQTLLIPALVLPSF